MNKTIKITIIFFCIYLSKCQEQTEDKNIIEDDENRFKKTNTLPKISCVDGTDHFCASCKNDKCVACYASKDIQGICKPIETLIEFCSQYGEDNRCIYCQYGYYLQNNICVKTSLKHCFTHHIEDSTKCGVCNGYVLNNDGQCDEERKCKIKNCKSCVIENEIELCLWCNDEYILAQDDGYKCVAATGILRNCFFQNSEGQCMTCRFGYYIDPTKEKKISNCVKSDMYEGTAIWAVFISTIFSSFILTLS